MNICNLINYAYTHFNCFHCIFSNIKSLYMFANDNIDAGIIQVLVCCNSTFCRDLFQWAVTYLLI